MPPTLTRTSTMQIKKKERSIQWWKPGLMIICFLGMAALRISQKLVPCGSLVYWALTLGLIPWCVRAPRMCDNPEWTCSCIRKPLSTN